jgi:hypothetical protein
MLLVRPTNFSGWDEWLVIRLVADGILDLPYVNRPYALLFHLPAKIGLPRSLAGFWAVHTAYHALTGILTFLLARRLRGRDERLCLLAGVFAATWAPLDALRLDAVLVANYSGVTATTLLAILLLVESCRLRNPRLLVLAGLLAFLVLRCLESAAGLLAAAPLLLWLVDGCERGWRGRAAAGWCVFVGLGLGLAAVPLLPGSPGSYQVSGLGFDPHPIRVAARLLAQLGYHMLPIACSPPRELLAPGVAASLLAFALAWGVWMILTKTEPLRSSSRASLVRFGSIGLAASVLGWSVLVLSRAIVTADRTQFLSAPGVGLVLAAAIGLAASWMPNPTRGLVAGALAAWVVVVGAGRTVAMQREWEGRSYWAAQNRALLALTDAVPAAQPNTLIVLIDEAGTWPANFTFRNAVEYLYERRVTGLAVGANDFLYPALFTQYGLAYQPWPVIRTPWRAPASAHRYDEIVVVRLGTDGRVLIADRWPDGILPPVPAGSAYAPRSRIARTAVPPVERAILRRE